MFFTKALLLSAMIGNTLSAPITATDLQPVAKLGQILQVRQPYKPDTRPAVDSAVDSCVSAYGSTESTAEHQLLSELGSLIGITVESLLEGLSNTLKKRKTATESGSNFREAVDTAVANWLRTHNHSKREAEPQIFADLGRTLGPFINCLLDTLSDRI